MTWSDRFISVIKRINSEYILFMLEDAFLLSPVDEKILSAAIRTIKDKSFNVGAIRFIPHIHHEAYKSERYNEYFSELPLDSPLRNSTIVSLTRKDYLLKLLRKRETPWDYEKFGAIRSRKCPEKILTQRSESKLLFDYEYQIKYGYGISQKKWLIKNKELFEKYGIDCNFSNLGWYENPPPKKITGLKRTKKEKLLLPFKEPQTFIKIVSMSYKDAIYKITHFRNRF